LVSGKASKWQYADADCHDHDIQIPHYHNKVSILYIVPCWSPTEKQASGISLCKLGTLDP